MCSRMRRLFAAAQGFCHLRFGRNCAECPFDASLSYLQCGTRFSNTDSNCLKVLSENFHHPPASSACRRALCMEVILAEYRMKKRKCCRNQLLQTVARISKFTGMA